MMGISVFLISLFTFVELNCENLFDCRHDTLRNDTEFLPEGNYHWTPSRYWRKLNRVGQTILACGGDSAAWQLPDLVALCEVENDSVMHDLTRRSLLRKARYEYVMTDSPDERGMDVALLYSPFSFTLINHRTARVALTDGMRPTRDILYASGRIPGGDTLHVVVAHFPSRRNGERISRAYRMSAAQCLVSIVDSVQALSPDAKIIVAGDFNEYAGSIVLDTICSRRLTDVSAEANGSNGAHGTYRYRGEWGSLDHIFASISLHSSFVNCFIADESFLLTTDDKYGGVQPFRTYLGPKYLNGFSDHLPLVAQFQL